MPEICNLIIVLSLFLEELYSPPFLISASKLESSKGSIHISTRK